MSAIHWLRTNQWRPATLALPTHSYDTIARTTPGAIRFRRARRSVSAPLSFPEKPPDLDGVVPEAPVPDVVGLATSPNRGLCRDDTPRPLDRSARPPTRAPLLPTSPALPSIRVGLGPGLTRLGCQSAGHETPTPTGSPNRLLLPRRFEMLRISGSFLCEDGFFWQKPSNQRLRATSNFH